MSLLACSLSLTLQLSFLSPYPSYISTLLLSLFLSTLFLFFYLPFSCHFSYLNFYLTLSLPFVSLCPSAPTFLSNILLFLSIFFSFPSPPFISVSLCLGSLTPISLPCLLFLSLSLLALVINPECGFKTYHYHQLTHIFTRS